METLVWTRGRSFPLVSDARLRARHVRSLTPLASARTPSLALAQYDTRGGVAEPFPRCKRDKAHSSASASSDGGTSRPSALAALRLMTNSRSKMVQHTHRTIAAVRGGEGKRLTYHQPREARP